jgi:hypothetical protein
MPALLPDASDLLLASFTIASDDDVVETAMNEVRAEDASGGQVDRVERAERTVGLDAVVSYEDRLIKAANDAGLATVSSRD